MSSDCCLCRRIAGRGGSPRSCRWSAGMARRQSAWSLRRLPAQPAGAGRLRRGRPVVVIRPARGAGDLAVPLSVAVRIEPELIRAIRLAVLPYLDVAAESDLWFSDLVASRGPDSIVLKPEVLPGLRAQ